MVIALLFVYRLKYQASPFKMSLVGLVERDTKFTKIAIFLAN